MRRVQKSAIVAYSPQQMFDLVNDIETYPEFLPWCSAARVLRDQGDHIVAELEMQKGGMRRRFSTRNQLAPHETIRMALIDGPFRELHGEWAFAALGDTGCEVRLKVQFEFAGLIIDMALGQFFESTCRSLVDAFIARARNVYGSGAPAVS